MQPLLRQSRLRVRRRWLGALGLLGFAAAVALRAGLASQPPGLAQAMLKGGHSSDGPEEGSVGGSTKPLHKELPHWFHSGVDRLLQPAMRHWPRVGVEMRLRALRRQLPQSGHGLVEVGSSNGKARKYRMWRMWLWEVCYIYGFTLPESRDIPSGLDGAAAAHLLCPDLWVDEAWPPSPFTPRSDHHILPVWSVAPSGIFHAVGDKDGERGIIILQAELVRQMPAKEVKALIGWELAQSVTSTGSNAEGTQGWLEFLTAGHLVMAWARAASSYTGAGAGLWPFLSRQKRWQESPGRAVMGALAEQSAPVTSLLLTAGNLAYWFTAPGLQEKILVASASYLLRDPAAEIFEHQVSSWGGETSSETGSVRRVALARASKPVVAAAALKAAGSTAAARSRSAMISADRMAAIAAGDATAAASALLRIKGLLSEDARRSIDQLSRCLREIRGRAAETKWAARKTSWMQSAVEPDVEVRIFEMLQWSEGKKGGYLLSMANHRREEFQRHFSWLRFFFFMLPHIGPQQQQPGEEAWWHSTLAWPLVAIMLLLPSQVSVEATRWASLCTFSITCVFGLLSPLVCSLSGGSSFLGVGLFQSFVVSVLLFIYSIWAAAVVWWYHMLGGAKRWVDLSAQLGSQVADQADTAAGMAYLARNWAEMARQSLSTLDEELCGSWRTSLQELASKLSDMQRLHRSGTSQANDPMGMSQQSSWALSPLPKRQESNAAGESQESIANLWSKVDASIQRTLAIETKRMRRGLALNDSSVLKDMVTWWEGPEETIMSRMMSSSHSDGHVTESLTALSLSGQLHSKYEYRPFSEGVQESRDRPNQPTEETFQRLEAQLQRNYKSVQELRSRVEPILQRRSEVLSLKACAELFRESHEVWQKILPGVDYDVEEGNAEQSVLRCLTGYAGVGAVGALWFAMSGVWIWSLAAVCFSVANTVLVLNHNRLAMPYVHTRLQKRVDELASRRAAIRTEVYMLEKICQKQDVVYLKANIHRQSVNVLRNINYMVLCIKTELQRTIANRDARCKRQQALAGYLRLLHTLLPGDELHAGRDWISDDDCARLASWIGGKEPHAVVCESQESYQYVRTRLIESQKRLWMVFRLLHFSSVLPGHDQGQLRSLKDHYFFKVLIERQLPCLPTTSFLPPGIAGGNSQKCLMDDSHYTGSSPMASKDSSGSSSGGRTRQRHHKSSRRPALGDGGSGAQSSLVTFPSSKGQHGSSLAMGMNTLRGDSSAVIGQALLSAGKYMAQHSSDSRR